MCIAIFAKTFLCQEFLCRIRARVHLIIAHPCHLLMGCFHQLKSCMLMNMIRRYGQETNAYFESEAPESQERGIWLLLEDIMIKVIYIVQ